MPRAATKTRTKAKAAVSTRAAVAISVAVALVSGAVAAAGVMVMRPVIILRVSGSSLPASASYAPGTQDARALGLEFRATEALSLNALTLSFLGEKDGDFSTFRKDLKARDAIEDCQLYRDDGMPVGAEVAFTSANVVRLSNLSVAIPANQMIRLEARCDLKPGNPSDGTPDAFAVSLPRAAFVAVRRASNKTVPARNIEVIDRKSVGVNVRGDRTVITVSAASAPTAPATPGTLRLNVDGATPNSTIILGNSTGVPTAKFLFSALDEPFLVKKLSLENFIECNSGIAAAVKIAYQNQAGATVTKTGFLSDDVVIFSGLDFFVPEGVSRPLAVTIDTSSVGSSTGVASGDCFHLWLDADTRTFEAVGTASGTTIDETDLLTEAHGNRMTIRKTKPTISLASGSPSGAGVPGLNEVFRFNVAADSRGFVTLDSVLFKMTSSGSGWNRCNNLNDTTRWEFYDIDDPSEKLDDGSASGLPDSDWLFDDGGNARGCFGDATLKYANLVLNNNEATPSEEIGAGETKTYVVRMDTTGASADDAIRLDIADQAEASLVGMNAITWDDDFEGQDIGGALVKNLPITGGLITY
ncbi:hypothetical protein A2856_02790 [Candidatus Uhrbacteria bacterium RIFCSPHIGHO2_01_FULL_63_20]|uniref:Uncharacterized protein n=1 Tax=Candidatus Uhrbacteria bacterium RIFCSPHIGHO2_01_FULL_63_20 TaxID=1802385 RepID=A0A1F7TKU3_9BACT|nr:MAG: hypothetical protein A2856_02790 [Candidatus Uhrbacteria bacterium RIFCSPHIGHO2_01_FULL_63_20]